MGETSLWSVDMRKSVEL